jgi:hypothetical protein
MSSAIIHQYMDANPESEQIIFNKYWAVFSGNPPFGHSNNFSKKCLHGGAHLIFSPLLFARKAGRTACLQTDN